MLRGSVDRIATLTKKLKRLEDTVARKKLAIETKNNGSLCVSLPRSRPRALR